MIMNIPNVIWKSAWKYFVSPRVCYVFKDYDDLKKNLKFSRKHASYIYAGELYSDYYNDPNFISNLTKAAEAGCQVQVILGPALYANNDKFLSLACRPNSKFTFYKRRYRDDAHFKIILTKNNKKWAIIDRKHPIGAGSESRGRSVLLLRGYDQEINSLLQKFEQQRANSKAIEPCNIIKEFSKQEKAEGQVCGLIVPREGGIEFAEQRKIRELVKTLNSICDLKKSPRKIADSTQSQQTCATRRN